MIYIQYQNFIPNLIIYIIIIFIITLRLIGIQFKKKIQRKKNVLIIMMVSNIRKTRKVNHSNTSTREVNEKGRNIQEEEED